VPPRSFYQCPRLELGNQAKSLPILTCSLCIILDSTAKEILGLDPGLENLKLRINPEEKNIYE
jgi:hypothetical protein